MSNGVSPYLGFVAKFNKDLLEFLRRRPGIDLEALDHATEETVYPLDKARNNKLIHNRSGDRIFIMAATGFAQVRFNRIDGPIRHLRIGFIAHPFKKIFLTNEAQPGKSVSIIIAYEAFIEFASPYTTIKLLTAAGIEINPATREKQDIISTDVQKITSPVSIKDESTGAVLSLTLQVEYRRFLEIFVKSSAAAIFRLYGSMDNITYRLSDEIILDDEGELLNGYYNAKNYIKVITEQANNNEIEITAS